MDLIGGVGDLNTPDREVAVKVGVFNQKKIFPGHATVDVVDSIVHSFNMALQVYLVESDNYKGTGLERLQVWKEIFTERVMPFSLSTDNETRQVEIAAEKICLSRVLFKPNVFISTHVLRRIGRSIGTLNLASVGSILKNLLGLMPERKKAGFHKKLTTVLLDAHEAIGGIDLAVLDGTYTYLGVGKTRKQERTNVLLVGRDAIAVEAVGASLAGLNTH